MTTPRLLRPSADLPAPVLRMIDQADWPGLIQALADGLPANLESHGDVPLFEKVLFAFEQAASVGQAPTPIVAPLALLEAFIHNGLTRDALYGGAANAVSLAAHYGQWDWMHRLLEEGFPAEPPGGSTLAAITSGRLHRAIALGQAEDLAHAPSDPERPASAPSSPDASPLPAPAPEAGSARVLAFPGRRAPAPETPQDEPTTPAPSAHPLVFDAPGEQRKLVAVVQALVDHGARLEVQTPPQLPGWMPVAPQARSHFTPLLHAIFHLDRGMVRALLAAGADLARRPEDLPYRPLEMAVARGSVDLVEDLIAAGAPLEPDATHSPAARMLSHPLLLCARMGLPGLVEPVAEAVPEERRQRLGAMAMNVAAANGQVPVMRALRLQGIGYDAPTENDGFRPMHQAAFAGEADTLAFLLRRGQKWDSANGAGLTARDILQSRHPGLLARFGLEAPGNVAVLFGRKRRP